MSKPNPNKDKISLKPGTLLSPVPAVMVTCCDAERKKHNIITIAWAGTICTNPPMLSISVRPERHSYKLISESKEFCVNVPTKDLAKQTDICGVLSGAKHDKFHETGLTKGKCSSILTPLILECPLNIECKVTQEINLGSHIMFLAEVVAVQVTESLINSDDQLDLEKAKLLCYAHGHYYQLGKQLGRYGFSVKKR